MGAPLFEIASFMMGEVGAELSSSIHHCWLCAHFFEQCFWVQGQQLQASYRKIMQVVVVIVPPYFL